MSKIKLGDIFEIETKKGKAYFQCVHSHKVRGELIKVFNCLYEEQPPKIESVLLIKDFYYIGFPLIFAYKKNIVKKVGNIPLSNDFIYPKYMRDKHIVRGEFIGWHIIDTETLHNQLVKELTEEQKQLSPFGIVNDTYLKERLEEGWTLSKWC